MRIEDFYIEYEGKKENLIVALQRLLYQEDCNVMSIFAVVVNFVEQLTKSNLLDLTDKDDLQTFETEINLIGVMPYTKRGNTDINLIALNPALSEKLYKMMLKSMKEYPKYIHKGAHNLGTAQFSVRNIDEALLNISEAMRTDYFATGGNIKLVKERPAFQVLDTDLKRIYGAAIQSLIDGYNATFNKTHTMDEFLKRVNKLVKKSFLIKLYMYKLLDSYGSISSFSEDSFPPSIIKMPTNEWLMLLRFSCLRNEALLFEEILRNVLKKPRFSNETLKKLVIRYLDSRGVPFKSSKRTLMEKWDKNSKAKRDYGLASFCQTGNKTVQMNNKVTRILKGNKTVLNSSSKGCLLKSFLMSGLLRNYTSHHLDLNPRVIKDKSCFESVFRMCFYSVIFVLFEDTL